ncbi:MAG TPA: hypothetical protein VGK30_00545 [Candidatus Binatia bacterium]|jgi:hypothetical protein
MPRIVTLRSAIVPLLLTALYARSAATVPSFEPAVPAANGSGTWVDRVEAMVRATK